MVLKQQRWFFQKGGQPAGTEAEQQESKGPVLKVNHGHIIGEMMGKWMILKQLCPQKGSSPFCWYDVFQLRVISWSCVSTVEDHCGWLSNRFLVMTWSHDSKLWRVLSCMPGPFPKRVVNCSGLRHFIDEPWHAKGPWLGHQSWGGSGGPSVIVPVWCFRRFRCDGFLHSECLKVIVPNSSDCSDSISGSGSGASSFAEPKPRNNPGTPQPWNLLGRKVWLICKWQIMKVRPSPGWNLIGVH